MKRYGMAIGLKKDKIEEYKKLHAEVWPSIIKLIKKANISNYSIYLGRLEYDKYYLFGYFEYVGDDFEADMTAMSIEPEMKRWWQLCEPCQLPLETRVEGEWWLFMEEFFHAD